MGRARAKGHDSLLVTTDKLRLMLLGREHRVRLTLLARRHPRAIIRMAGLSKR